MKFENTRVMNFEGAFRGLRNPLESWEKSDSEFHLDNINYCEADWEVATSWVQATTNYDYQKDYDKFYQEQEKFSQWLINNGVINENFNEDIIEYAFIGPKDMDLAHRMIKAGSSDSKFLRQIFVSVDITAPLYWYKEFDTYKVATVANSTSTMHKLASTPITIDCFEMDDFIGIGNIDNEITSKKDNHNMNKYIFSFDDGDNIIANFIDFLESLRQRYLETKDKRYWKELIRWLPNGWLQTRTWTANYAVLRNIYFQRKNHKLVEWHKFCDWIESLPYAADLITYIGAKE